MENNSEAYLKQFLNYTQWNPDSFSRSPCDEGFIFISNLEVISSFQKQLNIMVLEDCLDWPYCYKALQEIETQ